MSARPWFLWSVEMTEEVFRERLRDDDAAIRAQWQGLLMREARWHEVWQYLRLRDVLGNWDNIQRHLGRKREFWVWLIDGWRKDGLLDDATTDAPAT
ncbi:MAG: hypothetical protein Q8L14_34110 [Myxococcales bacterium]|nr:hypothetical protein [Myxococcales bacterium]